MPKEIKYTMVQKLHCYIQYKKIVKVDILYIYT